MTAPILPGAVLGVLGGGQLGRMFALAARRMGYRVKVLTPETDSPAGQVADGEVCAAYEDLEAVGRFAAEVAVVTFEFENVPSATALAAERHAPVRPAGDLLFRTQQRLREKRALVELGLPVTAFAAVACATDLPSALAQTGPRGVLKTAAFGYDGKGQARIDGQAALASAWHELGEVECILEAWVEFRSEVSIIGARGLDGTVALYDPILNHHEHHILDVSLCAAPLSREMCAEAQRIARAVLEGFDVVGVLCVEMFLVDGPGGQRLLINELAPRPHNSGHLTIDAHVTSQFEQQVRAVCGLPLGSTERLAPAAAMANLLGDLWQAGEPNWPAALVDPGLRLHLYGKTRAAPGRKMGHLTVLDRDIAAAERRVRSARALLPCPKR